MNNINKLIFHYICEICIVLILVGVSVPVCSLLNKSGAAKIAQTYATMDYLYLDIDKYLSRDSFEDVINVVNETNTKRGYDLIVKIDKKINTQNTEIKVNENVYKLNEIKYNSDNKFNYYLIANGELVAGKKEFVISYENASLKYNDVQYEINEIKNI